jgi:hypothetical protein
LKQQQRAKNNLLREKSFVKTTNAQKYHKCVVTDCEIERHSQFMCLDHTTEFMNPDEASDASEDEAES